MNRDHRVPSDPAAPAPLGSWKGIPRYEVVRVIGQGGMGAVYEAVDHERRQRVALKTLLNFTPDALYRFKNEFRTLVDIRHRNLVRLHEFVMADERVFFTMELVRGIDFRTYVSRSDLRAPDGGPLRLSSPAPTRLSADPVVLTAAGGRRDGPSLGATPADPDRLRAALLGLAEGVHALHRAGKLHRDIKPSNVLVTAEGRVVLLDFGVATELSIPTEEADAPEFVGTARYMAPEQAMAGAPTTASDWYSFGVMLYEALVGRPPFVGSVFEILSQKNVLEVPPPSATVTGVPDDLDILCRALLQIEPAMRPAGGEIVKQLRARRGAGTMISNAPLTDADALFIGRETHLAQLRDALEATRAGRSITVRVGGTSGMGKSTLMQRFLGEVAEGGDAIVLRGRAYERESVPYKAVDGVVDALSRHLMRLSETDPSIARVPGISALARLFPVLRRVPSIGEAAEEVVADPREVRRRAFAGLRDLLTVIGQQQPLVVYIDDVQWGDTDSAALLVELMRAPRPAPLLLLMTYRDNEIDTSAFLSEMSAHWPPGAEMRDVMVGPLDRNDSQRLALALLASVDDLGERVAHAAARESAGSPFLIEELVRSNRGADATGAGTLSVLTIDQMVAERCKRLPEDARRLLEIVAVGGRPLAVQVVADAARIIDVDDIIALAVSRNFVRTGWRDGHEMVEMSHDRIRDAVVGRLSASALRGHHARLANVLESTAGADLEAVAVHLQGAGDTHRAATFAERAAEQAAAKLAFEQAIRLYRMAIEKTAASPLDARRLHLRLAQVLEWAGRGTEAAHVYLRAAEDAPALQRVDIERAAGEQLLTCGRIDEGVAVLDRILASVRMGRPRSALTAIVWLLLFRLYLRVRGLRFVERDPDDVDRLDRAKIDILYSVEIGLSFVDAIQAACVQARHLILALKAGDRLQVLRAAALGAATAASAGGRPSAHERELSGIVQRLAEASEDSESRAVFLGTRGVSLFLRGQWSEALEHQDVAYAKYPNNRAGWHANGQLIAIWSLTWLGRIEHFRERQARLLVDAEQRGDLYTTVNLRIGYSNLAWLAIDEVDAARRHVREAMAVWSHRGFHLQHYRAMLADANIELYAGEGARAYDRIARDWAALEKSYLLRVQYIRADAQFARARAALASSDRAPDGRARLAEAERLARSLAGERMAWTQPLATMVRAGVASMEPRGGEAAQLLRTALEEVEAAEMAMHAAAIRYQLGSLLGGDAGAELTARAERAMTSQGIRVPARFAAMLAPGRWGEQA
jgi:serine/threonine protein kinase/tetratricopeptide (TPR) repeat protein